MRGITLTLMLAFLLALPIPLYARGSDELPGKDAPKYTELLDVQKWMETCSPKELLEILDMGLGDEGEEFYKALEDACGCKNWEQNILRATLYEGNVYIKTALEYKPLQDDESICALLADWKPCKPQIIKGFSRDNLLALYSLGNPKGVLDASMKWFADTDSIPNIIESLPLEEEEAFIKLMFKQMQMIAKGYWYDAKEDYYPLLGDEMTLAVYTNENYVGWDNIWSAKSPEEYMMARIILAVETAKPGLADEITKVVEDYIDIFSELGVFYGHYGNDPEEEIEILTMEADGYTIRYIDIEGVFKIGWTEYGGAFFVSDPATLKNLPAYFDKSLPNKMDVNKFNQYMYLNTDRVIDVFYDPIEWFFKDEFTYWTNPSDKEGNAALDEMNKLLLSGELGEIEVVKIIDGHNAQVDMKAGQVSADLMLKGIELYKGFLKDKSSMGDAIRGYLGFYGGS